MRKSLVLLAFASVLLPTTLSVCVPGLLELHIAYASPYTNISVDTAYDMITNGSYPDLVVLDVRWQHEYELYGHIYRAVWIPYTELGARIGELAGHENHEIIVYCASGGRSVTASNTLESNGFTKVYNMLGGFNQWDDYYSVWFATVHNVNTTFSYDTIQAAIDVPQTFDGHTILVDAGTYLEHVSINKSLSLVGENRETTIIDGNGTGNVVYVTADNVSIKNFTIQNSGSNGIYAYLSNGNNISHNNITNNDSCIYLEYSSNNTISGNKIANSSFGVYLKECSDNNIPENTITNNYYGIYFNSSSSNIISGNNLTNNPHGIWLEESSDNEFYHNNLIDNPQQTHTGGAENIWDEGYPSGGNYWSNYTGVDSNHDGIGDTPHIIAANNTDRYPLMNPWTTIETSVEAEGTNYPVIIVSNTTISQIVTAANVLQFESLGLTGEKGYINVIFPMVNTTEIEVSIDGNTLSPPPFPVINTNGTYYFIYFEFALSTHTIRIQFGPTLVGGISLPVSKLSLLAPYIIVTAEIILVASISVAYIKVGSSEKAYYDENQNHQYRQQIFEANNCLPLEKELEKSPHSNDPEI